MALQSKARYFNSRSEKNFPEFKFKTKKRKRTFFRIQFQKLETKINRQNGQKTGKIFLKFSESHVFFKTLQLESQMGPMPYLKKIFQYSDAETQKNLKLVNKAFWKEHALSKYRNNFSPAQEPRHNQLYCHGPCPNVDHFEVKTFRVLMRK